MSGTCKTALTIIRWGSDQPFRFIAANPINPAAPNSSIDPSEGSGVGIMPAFHGSIPPSKPHGGEAQVLPDGNFVNSS